MSVVAARHGRRWIIAAVVVVLAVVGVGVALLTGRSTSEHDPDEALTALASAWSSGHPEAGPLVDSGGVAAAYRTETADLGASPPTVKALGVTSTDDSNAATGRLQVSWRLSDATTWQYETTAALVRQKRAAPWQVRWSPAVVHPQLRAGDALARRVVAADRAPITGAGDAPLVVERPVVHVGVEPSRVKDLPALTQRLAALLTIDPVALTDRVKAAAPTSFVDVITLRQDDYDRLRAQLQPLPGTVFTTDQLPLAPTRVFARALLGTVGPATADQIKGDPGLYRIGQDAGQSGIEEQYERRLAGAPGVEVVLRRAGATRPVFTVAPKPGAPLRTTLDPTVQQAADAALVGQSKPSALVAVRVSTGDVLAVANGPDGGAYDLALDAKVPPGSTFKVVTTLALLEGGLSPETPVACEPSITVDGRSFRNAEREAFGLIPFSTDFARSCNTAFVSLAPRLAPDSLRRTGASLGLGVPLDLGVPAFTGSIPVTTDAVDRAASAFGQGRIELSPLSVAVASAGVAKGSLVTPRLVLDPAPVASATPSAAALPPGPVATLRTLMREVVTSGTGTALAAVPGAPVYGKTGTAEYGSGPNPPSHAWFTGWQGDIAYCVFVQGGEFGGDTAAPIAARFLTTLDQQGYR